ncbi:MAG: 3',5'-cyclic adenosine monophosphate phosphodiesterase CpdA [Syntrophomonadaceae bacterium]|nr:3',5'-cyclic adenosine monophosphate phosphodiesterase CpdA [Bacillota bacterium]
MLMFIAVFLLMAILAGWIVWETVALSVEYVDVPIEGLPPEFDGFRIAQVSDLHGMRFDPAGREAQAIIEAGVDLIVVTGDHVHRNSIEGIKRVLPFMQALLEIAPVYAVSGNHDHWTDWPYIARRLREAGVRVLENSHVRIDRGAGEIILAGVSDPYTGHGNLTQALPAQADTVIVLLAHAPTWFEPWNAATAPASLDRVSLTLAGHTHGGQVKLPFLGAVTTASGRLFPPSHVEGLSREGDSWLYINRGLGQGWLAFRFLSRREVTIITLKSPFSE